MEKYLQQKIAGYFNYNEMQKILIMLSTYNGEKYLYQQLDSIITQAGVSFKLLIRDDGSKDGTLDIIHQYIRKHPEHIELLEGSNMGWRNSFFALLNYASTNYTVFDYFAFADQDDIWLPTKLSRAVELLNTLPDGPRLYCSNLLYYKDGVDYGTIRKHHVTPTVKSALIRNYATGCTILFDKKLLAILAAGQPNLRMAHDYWCYMTATLCGSTIVDDEAFILYRQHSANQIGHKPKWSDHWKRRLRSLSALIGHHDRERIASEQLRLNGSHMSAEAKEATKKLATYRHSLRSRLELLVDRGYTLNSPSNDFWLKLRIILGRL